MGLWTNLARVGLYAAAPYTGGWSVAAGMPAMSAIDAHNANKKAQKEQAANSTTPGSPNYSKPGDVLSYMGNQGQAGINNLQSGITNRTQGLENRYNVAADRSEADYNNLSNNYSSFMGRSPISYNPSNQNFGAYGGYEDFSRTGGYSEEDKQNIRARANAPIRATYANAQNNLSRRNVLAGGNLANAGASQARMARELSYSLGDQSLNTEAMLAEAIRSGRLAGLGGMTGIDTSRMQEGLANAGQNLNAQGMESDRLLRAMSGQTSLYGTTPGQTSMYGNQMLNSSGQGLQAQQIQQQLMQAILSGSLGNAQLPGGFDKGLGRTASIMNLIGQMASAYGNYSGSNGSSNGPGFGTTYSKP